MAGTNQRSLLAQSSGTVLSGNSSTETLASGATYTGSATDVSGHPAVAVAVKTDQAGTLYMEFSPDGTNWDSSLSFSVAAGSNEVHRLTVTRQYFRVRFTNTADSAQTYFRIQSLAGSHTALTSALNSIVQRDADTLVVRPLDFNLMVAEGLYQNVQNTIKDGFTQSFNSAAVPQDINFATGVYTGFPTSPVAAEIVVAGADTGTVYYSYMATDTDTDYTFASKAITGAGTYSLGHNIWRCNFAYFDNTGAPTSFNAGNITVQNVGGGNTFCIIPAGYSQTFCSAYTVPFGSTAYLDRITGNVRGSTSGSMDGAFYYKPYGVSPRYRFPFELQFGGLYFDDVDYLVSIPARTDIVPRILTSSTNNLSAKLSYRIVKVKS